MGGVGLGVWFCWYVYNDGWVGGGGGGLVYYNRMRHHRYELIGLLLTRWSLSILTCIVIMFLAIGSY